MRWEMFIDDYDKQAPIVGPIEVAPVVKEVKPKPAPKEKVPAPVVTNTQYQFWEDVETEGPLRTLRAKVPGGWLMVMVQNHDQRQRDQPAPTPIFIADPFHTWQVSNGY